MYTELSSLYKVILKKKKKKKAINTTVPTCSPYLTIHSWNLLQMIKEF